MRYNPKLFLQVHERTALKNMPSKTPQIIKRSQHVVSRRHIDDDALNVMRRLNRNGFKAYLVGGSVRDLLIGLEPKDFDVSTDAKPQEIKRLFRNCFLVGRRFRLAHVRFGRDKVIETSTFRQAPPPPSEGDDLVQWDDNQFGSPREDAHRRDFTINALFYDLSDFSLIDHVGGLNDLKRGLIRSIGDPNVRFREDPVRMVRAVRFASRLGFKIEARTQKAILKHYEDIRLASQARLLEEIYKLFAFQSAESAFFLLWDLKLLSVMIPELDQYIKDTGGKRSAWWRYPAALDSGEHWPHGELPHSLKLAVLFDALVQQEVHKRGGGIGAAIETIQSVFEPISIELRLPRVVRYRVMRLIENQVRMDIAGQGPAPKSRVVKRMLAHPSFTESLALLEIRCAAGGTAPEVLAYWKQERERFKALGELTEGEAHQSPAPSRKRRPRRRSRRSSSGRGPSHA